jgi:hypothetical protein
MFPYPFKYKWILVKLLTRKNVLKKCSILFFFMVNINNPDVLTNYANKGILNKVKIK